MRRSLFLCCCMLALAGCSSSSFVGRRIDNFTAYYNTLYNANRLYEQAVAIPDQQAEAVDRSLLLPVFLDPLAIEESADLENVITKSADVLREHPGSGWVDDALLLIGKAYYHQRNYVGAQEKFSEVLSLSSPLEGEARFWLARTLIANRAYDRAYEHLLLSLLDRERYARWEPMLRLALGELHVKREEWARAAEELTKGIEAVGDRVLQARAQFLLGQVYEEADDYEQAVAAFSAVETYRPHYNLSYAAKVSAIRVAGLYGDSDWALESLGQMERDTRHTGNRAELGFLRGRIHQAASQTDDALAAYQKVLDDANTPAAVRGRIHYALGELFRDQPNDFILAAAHFDSAAAVLVGESAQRTQAMLLAGAGPQYSREAILDAEQQAEHFRSFAALRQEIARMDSLLYLSSMDDDAFEEYMLSLRQQRVEEAAELQRELNRRQVEQNFQADATAVSPSPVTYPQTAAGATAGFLFHRDPVRVQESRLIFASRWGDRPLVPGWRRLEAARVVAGQFDINNPVGDSLADPLFPADAAAMQFQNEYSDLPAVPRDPASINRMRAERAAARYELGNVLFLSMNLPDSAAVWYRLILKEDAEQPVASRALYALAEVQRTLGDTASARANYEQVLARYPDSDFAPQVLGRLGLPQARQTTADSTARAEQAYNQVAALWRQSDYAGGIQAALELAANYPSTATAPQALLAAAAMFTEWARIDSLDLTGEIPLSVSDSLLAAAGFSLDPGEPPPPITAGALLAADSQEPPPARFRLEMIYELIARKYPQTAYAQQAERLLNVLTESGMAPSIQVNPEADTLERPSTEPEDPEEVEPPPSGP
jgi:cellulose synthase operon protein C